MSKSEHDSHSNLHLVQDEAYETALDRLLQELEPFHHTDPELHQLYLETVWLLRNQQSGELVLPTRWELIIFQMVQGDKLKKHREALRAAGEVVRIIRKVAHCDSQKAV